MTLRICAVAITLLLHFAAWASPAATDAFVAEAERRGTDALYVSRNGETVIDWARGDRKPIELMSTLKSVVALAIGRMLQEGDLETLDEPVHLTYPEWNQGSKKLITIRHLLNHTSGLQDVPNAGAEIYPSPDAIKLALAAEVSTPPGTQFSYSNKAVNLLAGIIAVRSGLRMDLYIAEKLFRPLGITDYQWYFDRSGNPHAMAGLRLRAADVAKLAALALNGGAGPKGQLISANYIKEMLSAGQEHHPRSGLLWWRLPAEQSTGDAIAAYYAQGYLGQFIVIVPSANLIAVRQIEQKPGLNAQTMWADFPSAVIALARELTKR